MRKTLELIESLHRQYDDIVSYDDQHEDDYSNGYNAGLSDGKKEQAWLSLREAVKMLAKQVNIKVEE